jgi:apolipoprotein N-acyltransferase
MNAKIGAKGFGRLPALQSLPGGLVAATMSVLAFHLAYTNSSLAFLMTVFFAGLLALSHQERARPAFYLGLITGLVCYAPHLSFFWRIFGPASVALWLVPAFWVALFVALTRTCRIRLGPVWAAVLAPILWTGFEYFRSEVYWLKFSWLNAGYAFSDSPQIYAIAGLGIYGIGFELMGVTSLISILPRRAALASFSVLIAVLATLTNLSSRHAPHADAMRSVKVAAIQMEFPAEFEVVQALNNARQAHLETDLFVLSEYTLDGPVPDRLARWCQSQACHLLVGGKDPLAGEQFFNTVFAVGPEGQVVFKQAKKVPIQFFKDGQPASEQQPWRSPWGLLGLAICYDLSYTRVMDRLVAQGAQALIVPTMDVSDWGDYEHRLHARVAPLRAAEYGLPILRVASSGISQLINERGQVTARGSYPGEKEVVSGDLRLVRKAQMPIDRWLAATSTALTFALLIVAMIPPFWRINILSGHLQPLASNEP